MKFYAVMVGAILCDMLFFILLSKFYMPKPGTLAFSVYKNAAFIPIAIVAVMQICKILIDMTRGYVISPYTWNSYIWYREKTPIYFFIGILIQMTLWGLLGYSVLNFLLRWN